jgi:hypothetical protein
MERNGTAKDERVIEFVWLDELKGLMEQVKDIKGRVLQIMYKLSDAERQEQDDEMRKFLSLWWGWLEEANTYLYEAVEMMDEVFSDADYVSRHGLD